MNHHNNICTKISITKTISHSREYFSLIGPSKRSITPKTTYIKWELPTKGFILNTDNSSKGKSGRRGIRGWVIRNIRGERVLGYISNLYSTNSLKAE